MSDIIDIEFFDDELGELKIEIEITHWTPIISATHWDPAEGGELEYVSRIDDVEFDIPERLEDKVYQLIATYQEG